MSVTTTDPPRADALFSALARLDDMIQRSLTLADARLGPPTAFRGLYIDRAEVEDLLCRTPLTSLVEKPSTPLPTPLASLARRLGLSSFDLDVVLIALGPELDSRYERLYAYLQDDVTRRRPSVGLALDLICTSAAEKIAARTRFAGDAPLVAGNVLALGGEPGPLLTRTLVLDQQVVRMVLGLGGLDERLAQTSRLSRPSRSFAELPLAPAIRRGLEALARSNSHLIRIYLEGKPGLGQRDIAEAIACALGVPLFEVDPSADSHVVAREAELQGAVLFVEGALDSTFVSEDVRTCVLSGPGPVPPGFVPVTLSLPEAGVRLECWQRELEGVGFAADAEMLGALSERFRLGPDQIRAAAYAVQDLGRWEAAGSSPPNHADVFAAARSQCGRELELLARRVRPATEWNDLVLPDGAMHQLRELCNRVDQRGRVLGEWGFGHKLTRGKGVSALFAGASGTGKTMAAEVVAGALELDLFVVDLARVVSKYIGETEKNLSLIFQAAEDASCILFFDEADALFGKRSEVRDSHDRYANLEISYLLQRIELFEGISILATNLDRNLDTAFVRRLDLAIHFPFPTIAERRRIWQGIWPTRTPVSPEVDFDALAERFSLSGGSIKSAALAAAYLAAADGGIVTEAHLLNAVRSEHEKAGRSMSEEDDAVAVASS